MLWVSMALTALGLAQKGSIEDVPGYWETCSTVHSRNDWYGYPQVNIDVSINSNEQEFVFVNSFPVKNSHDGFMLWQFTVVLYAYEDKDLLGISAPDSRAEYVCTNHTIKSGACTIDDYGNILLEKDARSKLPIRYKSVNFDLPASINDHRYITFDISNTSLYCVGIFPVQYCTHWDSAKCIHINSVQEEDSPSYVVRKLDADVSFFSSDGYLTASKGLLVLHFVAASICLLSVALWSWNSYLNRHNLVKIQHQVLIIGILMTCEQLITAFHYLSVSMRREFPVFLWFVAVFHAIRIVYMQFFLLLLCVGNSVVWETWSWTSLFYWIPLGAGTFFTLFVYSLQAYNYRHDGMDDKHFNVIVISVLNGLLLINFAWVISRLSAAKKYFLEKNQILKSSVYEKIRNCTGVYALVIVAFTIQLLVYKLSSRYSGFLIDYCNYSWFFLDGFPLAAYLFLYLVVSYQLRPSAYEQLPQDEDWLNNAGAIEMETFLVPEFDNFGRIRGASPKP